MAELKGQDNNILVKFEKQPTSSKIKSASDFYNQMTTIYNELSIINPNKVMMEFNGRTIKLEILSSASKYVISFNIHNFNHHHDKYYAMFKSFEKGTEEISITQCATLLNYALDEFSVIQYLGNGVNITHTISDQNIHSNWGDNDVNLYNSIKHQLENSKHKEIQKELIIATNTYLSITSCTNLEENDTCYLHKEIGVCKILGASAKLFCITDISDT